MHQATVDLKMALIVNSVDNKRMGIQPEAIERAMMPAIVHLPMDERNALRSANLGEPIMIKGTHAFGPGYNDPGREGP